jgi:hypothetical protein
MAGHGFWYRATLQITTPPLEENGPPIALDQSALLELFEALKLSHIGDGDRRASEAA